MGTPREQVDIYVANVWMNLSKVYGIIMLACAQVNLTRC